MTKGEALKKMQAVKSYMTSGNPIWSVTEIGEAFDMAIEALEQPEVIRCTECKHYREYDSEYVENAVVVQCMADRYPISETIPDGWFCAGAERKDDE